MAAFVAQAAPATPVSKDQDLFAFFNSSFHDITDQLNNGVVTPTVSFSGISIFGLEGMNVWKSYIE